MRSPRAAARGVLRSRHRPWAPTRRRSVPACVTSAVLAGAVLAGALVAGCAAPSKNASGAPVVVGSAASQGGYRGTVVDPPFRMPELTLTETSGRLFDLAAGTRNKPLTLVFFGYTHCPDVCPTVLAEVAAAKRRLPADQRDRVLLVFITTDPRRDTPEVIRDYLDQFDPSFVGLTGPTDVIEQAADALLVTIEPAAEQPGGGYTTDHGSHVVGFGPDGAGQLLWTPGTPIGDLQHDYAQFLTAGL